ncbi:TetR/AcrR family transcriptional regulator [Bradyrhizobium sp. HKCCYLS2038]|uniref:TetR/AcrR family transcriptional regulator n=1 Tax=unclassified Bradyrhizobium TaxID=2631580 RepID=UPI003EC05015
MTRNSKTTSATTATSDAGRSSKTGGAPQAKRRNLRAPERERLIVDEAIRFFAEHGFEGQTRELAKRMGIAHSVIYRHFPSKEALIERVYQEVYLSRWSQDWSPLIRDRGLPLQVRLTRFYLDYVARVFEYNWVRIFVFSGMKSFGIAGRYLDLVRREIIEPAAIELRHELKLPGIEISPLSGRETEMFWGLHGRIFYLAIRKFIYATPVPSDIEQTVRDAIELFLDGARLTLPRLLEHRETDVKL